MPGRFSQQFDWVVVIGAEDGVIPDFRATTVETRLEEARVLSVMISRARHGVVVTCSRQVPTLAGRLRDQNHSPFFTELKAAGFTNSEGVENFLDTLDWDAVAVR